MTNNLDSLKSELKSLTKSYKTKQTAMQIKYNRERDLLKSKITQARIKQQGFVYVVCIVPIGDVKNPEKYYSSFTPILFPNKYAADRACIYERIQMRRNYVDDKFEVVVSKRDIKKEPLSEEEMETVCGYDFEKQGAVMTRYEYH